MTPNEALEKLLPAYTRYYDVSYDAAPPFSATAEFHSHGEKYILVRKAKLWDMDSHEYVYFAARDALNEPELQALVDAAWGDAIPRVEPSRIHRDSDVRRVLSGAPTKASATSTAFRGGAIYELVQSSFRMVGLPVTATGRI